MTIQQILNDKGGAVVSIRAEATLRDAARLLDEKRIGAVVALDLDEKVIGVLSERDIVRRCARDDEGCLGTPVGESMTRDVVTVAPTTAINDALQLMTDRRIRHLPVLEEGRLKGVISIGDLVKWKIADTEAEAEAMKSYLSAQF